MKLAPNQKKISVSKEKQGKHTILSLEGLSMASRQLSGESFKLWLYLAKNQDGYSFGLSMVDALSWGVGSESSYHRAVKELINKGYLQKKNNSYIFYEISILNREIKNNIILE